MWTTPDPIGVLGGVNLYGYVSNNPVNKIDLLGLDEPGNGFGPDGTGMADTADTSDDSKESTVSLSVDNYNLVDETANPLSVDNYNLGTDLGAKGFPADSGSVMHDLKCVAALALDITGKIGKTIGKTVMGLATLARTGNPDPSVRALGEWETFLSDVESMSEEAQECKKQ